MASESLETVLVYLAAAGAGECRYLLLRRTAGRGGFWQGVSGRVEAGEEPAAAAWREVREETGFMPARLIELEFRYTFVGETGGTITEHVFLGLLDRTARPAIDAREHDAWAWCGFDEALARLRWPGNKEALRQCEARLRGAAAEESVPSEA